MFFHWKKNMKMTVFGKYESIILTLLVGSLPSIVGLNTSIYSWKPPSIKSSSLQRGDKQSSPIVQHSCAPLCMENDEEVSLYFSSAATVVTGHIHLLHPNDGSENIEDKRSSFGKKTLRIAPKQSPPNALFHH